MSAAAGKPSTTSFNTRPSTRVQSCRSSRSIATGSPEVESLELSPGGPEESDEPVVPPAVLSSAWSLVGADPPLDEVGPLLAASGFRDRIRDYQAKDVEILGVSFDSPEDNRAFAEKYDFPFRLLSDTDRSIALAYGACEGPGDQYPRRTTFVIGTGGEVEQAIDTQDPKGQADALLASL